MKLLALDTSTTYLSLALSVGGDTLAFHQCVEQKHAERTLPEVSRLLAEAGVALGELDGIVFDRVPAHSPDCASLAASPKAWPTPPTCPSPLFRRWTTLPGRLAKVWSRSVSTPACNRFTARCTAPAPTGNG